MLVLLLDAVGTVVDLPEPLLFVSLLCFPFILEQIDLKLKSSDLKLMMLKFRFTDFFVCGWCVASAFGGDDDDDGCASIDGLTVLLRFGEAISMMSSPSLMDNCGYGSCGCCNCAPSVLSLVFLVISKRSEFLLISLELSTC